MGDKLCESRRRVDYDIIRIFLTILVVIGHAAFYNIVTPFGGVYYQTMMEQAGITDTFSHVIISKLSEVIYLFHMQAFFCLSGAVYRIQSNNGEKGKYKYFFKKKFYRLMIPAIIIWFIWNLPIKAISGYYVGISIWKVLLQFVFSRRVYLWYLQALFIASILLPVVLKAKKYTQIVIVALLWIIGFLINRYAGDYIPFGNPFYYFPWLWLGYYVDEIISKIIRERNYRYFTGVLFIFFGFCFFLPTLKFLTINVGVPLYSILVIFAFSKLLWTKKPIENSAITKISYASSYCYGIYLYAEPLNYIILYLVYKAIGITGFGNELVSFLVIMLRVFITTIVAVGIVWLIRKNKIKYLC